MTDADITAHAASIVAAYVAHNALPPDQLPGLFKEVYKSLHLMAHLAEHTREEPAAPVELVPAVPVKKSVHPDYIVCLEDGKKFKSMRRHLTKMGMTATEYRLRWGLPQDYPMVAASYSAKRSKLAKANGLGRKA